MAQKLLRPGKFVQAKTERSLLTDTSEDSKLVYRRFSPVSVTQYGPEARNRLGAREFSKSSPVRKSIRAIDSLYEKSTITFLITMLKIMFFFRLTNDFDRLRDEIYVVRVPRPSRINRVRLKD